MRKTEPRLNPATCHIDGSLWRQAQAIAASNRSLPQNSSESTRKLGAPKIPRDRARSVAFRSLAFASGDRAELIRLAGRPIVLRTDVTTQASEMSRSCAKFARTSGGQTLAARALQKTSMQGEPPIGRCEETPTAFGMERYKTHTLAPDRATCRALWQRKC